MGKKAIRGRGPWGIVVNPVLAATNFVGDQVKGVVRPDLPDMGVGAAAAENTADDTAAELSAAQARERERRRLARGRAGTNVAGPLGTMSPATTALKTLTGQ